MTYNLKAILSELHKSLNISLSLLCAQFVYASSGLTIIFIIANLGSNELATNVLVWGIYITLALFYFGVQNAISGLVSQHHGANDKKGIHTIVAQGINLAIILTIPMSLIMWFAPQLLYWTGQNPTTIKLAIPYCHVLAIGILPQNILVVVEQFLIGISNTRIVLFASLLKVPMEILFMYIFVFGKLGAPKLGLSGIGYGVVLSNAIISLIIICYIHFSKICQQYKIFFNFLKFNGKYFYKLIRIGLPLGSMYCIELALFTTASFMMSSFGNVSLAAHQIAYQCLIFTLTITFGISQGTTVRIGYEAGSNNKNILKLVAFVNMLLAFFFMLIMAVLYIRFPDKIISLGIDINALKNQLIVKQASTFLSLAAILQLIDCFRLIAIGALRGLNDTKLPMYISIISFWLVAFPSAYFFAFILHLQGVGIWLGLIAGIFVSATVLLMRFKYLVASFDSHMLEDK